MSVYIILTSYGAHIKNTLTYHINKQCVYVNCNGLLLVHKLICARRNLIYFNLQVKWHYTFKCNVFELYFLLCKYNIPTKNEANENEESYILFFSIFYELNITKFCGVFIFKKFCRKVFPGDKWSTIQYKI